MSSLCPLAVSGPLLSNGISVLGVLAALGWIVWRFGPTLTRLTGWCSWYVAWACGSQGGYGYCVAFLALGTLAWSVGTVWYARRHGRWPSAISERVLTRMLGRRSPFASAAPSSDSVVVPIRRP